MLLVVHSRISAGLCAHKEELLRLGRRPTPLGVNGVDLAKQFRKLSHEAQRSPEYSIRGGETSRRAPAPAALTAQGSGTAYFL